MNTFMFYLLSGVILICSLLSVTTRRILRAAVYLLFVLVATAGLYFLLDYEFLAAVQLTLYAGGIVVLIIFSILLTSHISHRFKHPNAFNLIGGLGVALIGIATVLCTVFSTSFDVGTKTTLPVNMTAIGTQLLSTDKNGYVLPFELISILLLASRERKQS